jgi:alanyl-tRNA synthetase
MNAQSIRREFLEYFERKMHKIVPSAPIVNKNDPTLMFVNAGMNPFKDFFLGNKEATDKRVADTQKCLRVSGKHNDLEDVGIDGYHHTLFEMLGNWSFGDYFKAEAIEWAYDLLVNIYGLDKDRLYVTVFGGDQADGLDSDEEARLLWQRFMPNERILNFGKKDNFWEMGDTGPCGPCSEIHIDLRPEADRKVTDGKSLVNADHPDVIEIWNLVFIQFNRKADGSLESLPAKHVDTGMGFERLCRAVQGTASNYDTDVFTPFIQFIEKETGIKYTHNFDNDAKSDIAFRVIVDHIRAVAFTIADGQLPSNTGAGYVIRRILRRAVRYYYSFLDRKEPLLFLLVPILSQEFGMIFPEITNQIDLITSVIKEEERSFLRTLESGLKRLESLEVTNRELEGKVVFELYDTFGFPVDLTRLVAGEKGYTIDEKGFFEALEAQKTRSRSDAQTSFGDWQEVLPVKETAFVGYDRSFYEGAQIIKYRQVDIKGKPQYQLVLDITPFYAEGGGQVGDTGVLMIAGEEIKVLNTIRENDLILHIVDRLPANVEAPANAIISSARRQSIQYNHSATHLLHAALRQVLGSHVQQKGSLVNEDYLRFDFSHFQKVTDEEIERVEAIVNEKIRANIAKKEDRSVSMEYAKEHGAMMLFGEKYGEEVRMITFDPQYSIELCGGCHVSRTGDIGLLKITSEGAIAAGIRRIEAISGPKAENWIKEQVDELRSIKEALKAPKDTLKAVQSVQEELKLLRKELEVLQLKEAAQLKQRLLSEAIAVSGGRLIIVLEGEMDPKIAKQIIHQLVSENEDIALVFGHLSNAKPMINVAFSKALVNETRNAGQIIKGVSGLIRGGGGGQPFMANAGGSDSNGLTAAVQQAQQVILDSF